MKKTLVALAVAALTLSGGSAMAQKKQLVIVVKGLDNPFFEAIHQGCEKWNKENASSPYQCFYTGPASTSVERAADRQCGQGRQNSDNDNRRRPQEGGLRAAQDVSGHRQLSDGLPAGR